MDLSNLIRKVPKAELHIHIEGSMEPSLLFTLASRNSIALPYTLESCQDRRKNYQNLQDFLNLYYDACQVLVHEQDFFDLAQSYLQKAISGSVTHCEIFFDPQTHLNRGIQFGTIITGFHRASEEVKNLIHVQWILCFLRDLTQDAAFEVIKLAEPYKEWIHGVGLDSAEVGNPPEKFKDAYKVAADAGLCGKDCLFKVAHAREIDDSSDVVATLYYLGVSRIDHGVQAVESMGLCKFLKDSQIALTCCPLSNKMLKVEERFFGERKVVKELFDRGVVVTINSDDPAFFGGYICENFDYVISDFEESSRKEVLRTLCKNSFLASFISEEMKEENYRKIDEVIDSN